jgi:serine/threonine-protein kinase
VDNRLLPNLKSSLKLLDFGLAKAVGNTALTKTGLLAGTVYYLPPECLNKTFDWYPEADFYAVGVLLYEMITGLRPFEGEDLMSVMYKVLQHTPEPPALINRKLSGELSDFTMELIAKDKALRLLTYKKIRDKLDIIIGNTVNLIK